MNKTSPTTEQATAAASPRLPPDSAHNYICEMLKQLTDIADASELKELSALLRVTSTAAQFHQRVI